MDQGPAGIGSDVWSDGTDVTQMKVAGSTDGVDLRFHRQMPVLDDSEVPDFFCWDDITAVNGDGQVGIWV